MLSKSKKAVIVGAGVSGLAAAHTLESAGWDVVIVDRKETAGGRLATTHYKGIPLDKGFQVLLSAYPSIQERFADHLESCISFRPGALCFEYGNPHPTAIGDPLRDLGFAKDILPFRGFPLADKWRMYSLSRTLRATPLAAIFEDKREESTREYLGTLGFSKVFRNRFLHPFLAGIFLEPSLETPARMARFVLKMFAEGNAILPPGGIVQAAEWLTEEFESTVLRLSSPVVTVHRSRVTLESGELLEADAVLVAGASPLTSPTESPDSWRSVDNAYFETNHSGFGEPILGLLEAKEENGPWPVNNFHFLGDLYGKENGNIVSVTSLTGSDGGRESHEQAIRVCLEGLGIHTGNCIRWETVTEALPNGCPYRATSPNRMDSNGVFVAGDHLVYPSYQGAYQSGVDAARAILAQQGDR